MTDKLLETQVNIFLSNFKCCADQGEIDYSEVNSKTTDCGKINLHTIAAQKYITPQAA